MLCWKKVKERKENCCITDGIDLHKLFNMSCNRMLKYRIWQIAMLLKFYHLEISPLMHPWSFQKRESWIFNNENTLFDVRFEVFTAVTMKDVVFWDVVPCRSCVNRRFVGTYRLHLQAAAPATTCSRWFLTYGFFYPEDADVQLSEIFNSCV
jgi:hypothetical protein